jgi:hypothetical protein
MPVKRTETKAAKAPSTRKPAARRKRISAPAHDHVAVRAYYLHLEGGLDSFENWIRAERELVEG